MSNFKLVHELIFKKIKKGSKFRVGCSRCTPSYKDFFADSYGSASLFLCQLVSSFRKCPFGLETACFDGALRSGIWRAKIPVQNVLQNLVQKHHKTVCIFQAEYFLQRLMFNLSKISIWW